MNKDLIVDLFKKGYSLKKISEETGILIGHFKQEGSIKRILYLKSRAEGGKASMWLFFTPEKRKQFSSLPTNFFKRKAKDKEWHEKNGHKGGTATQIKYRGTLEQKEWFSRAGKTTWLRHREELKEKIKSNPNKRNWCIKGGLTTSIKHPNHVKHMRDVTLKNNPNFYNENSERLQNIIKLQPELAKKAAINSRHSYRKNLNKLYKNIYFHSLQEIKCCKILEKRGFVPVDGKSVHISIGKKEFDFLFNDVFIEYHPYDYLGKSSDEYYKDRKKILEEKGIKNSLLVITSIDDLKIKLGE